MSALSAKTSAVSSPQFSVEASTISAAISRVGVDIGTDSVYPLITVNALTALSLLNTIASKVEAGHGSRMLTVNVATPEVMV